VAFGIEDIATQPASLRRMTKMIADGLTNPKTAPLIIRTARKIVSDCDARDDRCEVEAIFDAVKEGTDKIPGLSKGLRYVSDPRTYDYFSSAAQTLKACQQGSCAGDCDDASILVSSLLLALGFKVGVRAWGPKPGVKEYTHVYPVVAIPKNAPSYPAGYGGHGVDVTTPESYVGWEPRKGEVLTYWIDGG